MGIRFVLSIDCGQTIFGTMAERPGHHPEFPALDCSALLYSTEQPPRCHPLAMARMGRTAGLLLKAPSYTSDAIFSPKCAGSHTVQGNREPKGSMPLPTLAPFSISFSPTLQQGLTVRW